MRRVLPEPALRTPAASVLAVVFVGQGIASFQEAGVAGATFVNHVPTIAVLGLYPTVQSLAAQAALTLFAAAAIVWPQAEAAAPAAAERAR